MSYSGEFVDKSKMENDSGNCQINDDGEVEPSDDIRIQQVYAANGLSKGIRFFSTPGYGEASIRHKAGNTTDEENGSHIRFETGGTCKMRINYDGNIQVGSDLRPYEAFCIGGSGSMNRLLIHKNTSRNAGGYITGGENTYGGHTDGVLDFGLHLFGSGYALNAMTIYTISGGTRYIDVSGHFTFRGNTSDDRLKENETAITGAVATLNKLKPYKYNKKPSIDSTNPDEWKPESGLLAQDVWYDAPELRNMVLLNADSNPAEQNDKPDYPSWGENPVYFDYNQMIAYLIKAIQELSAEIEILKSK